MHGHTGDVGVAHLDLAGVQSGAYLESDLTDRIADGTGAGDRPRRTVEQHEEAVTHRLDLPPTEALDLASHLVVVTLEDLGPPLVPQIGGAGGGPGDVCEQHRCEDALVPGS